MKDLKILNNSEKELLNPLLLDIISYRKSGLSLNHIIGCSLDCAYCVRHFFDNFEMKEPHLLCSDQEAVEQLINHKFFIPDITPIQIFNRATDPFLPKVKFHTLEILKLLDNLNLKNLVLIITRASVTKEDMEQLEQLRNIKVSLLITYSGITDTRIEPIAKNNTTVKSIETIAKYKNKTKLILYWRPIVMGWNDSLVNFERVFSVGKLVDAIVYTGYYHRPENYDYLKKIGVNIDYGEFARRKFLPEELENKILNSYNNSKINVPLFRKTSCGVTYAHGLADYNGHWGVNEICDICPSIQKDLCNKNYSKPLKNEFQNLLEKYDYITNFLIEEGHIWTEGLGEEKRYHLQHTLGFQIWDINTPHFTNQHGRSKFGQRDSEENNIWLEKTRLQFYNINKEYDD